jgi:DNA-binding XRE family transcriptional regulator
MPPSSTSPSGHVGRNLRHLVGMHDLSRGHAARQIGISTTALTNILHGRSEPTLRTARNAARAFGISFDELYGDLKTCLYAAVAAFDEAPIQFSESADAETPAAPTTPSSAIGANDHEKSYRPDTLTASPLQA